LEELAVAPRDPKIAADIARNLGLTLHEPCKILCDLVTLGEASVEELVGIIEDTIDEVVQRSLRLHPVLTLQEIARERGWNPIADNPSSCLWSRGMVDLTEGEESVHSAALALADLQGTVRRRIWSAEVGVMLPFVEERHQKILSHLAGVLKVPFTTRFGELISDVHDLEIGHIES
jgi:hypothetical protein